jgi:hypothetical protein
MIYKFKSEAAADLIMLEALGTQVLRIIAKESSKGIVQPQDMPAAIAALKAAVAQSEQVASSEDDEKVEKAVSLRARLWPFVTLLERSMAAKVPVTWGV